MKVNFRNSLPVIGLLILCLGLFAACGGNNDEGITSDEAKAIALEDGGFQEDGVNRLRVSEDRDEGIDYYEVDFQAEGVEYSYEIAKTDGTIISKDSDADSIFGDSAVKQNESGTTDTNTGGNSGANTTGPITVDEAKAIALAEVEGADESNIMIQQERDDGKDIYEGTIIYNGVEYEFEIEAATGNIMSWDENRQ